MRSLALVLMTLLMMAGTAHAADGLHYRVRVRVEPKAQRIEAEVWVQHPPAARFYLQKDLTIRRVLADGKPVPFARGSDAHPIPLPMAGLVSAEAKDCRELYVQYDGEMTEPAFGCNLITPDLVELAVYAVWYPFFPGPRTHTFELEADLPAGFVTVTNGWLRSQQERSGRSITLWQSYARGFDMVLLASPQLHKLEGGDPDAWAEVYYAQLPVSFVGDRASGLSWALRELSTYYGPPPTKDVLRLVYSPRRGQGYARVPLLIISEQRAQDDLRAKYGEARRFRDEVHELAHFWWMIADPGTPDDWINEALAEYSAFRVTTGKFGKGFADLRLREYRQHAAASRTDTSIAETDGSSPDREINRYDKATLMLLEARARFGEASLDRLLRSLYTRFGTTHDATTARFLAEAKARMGVKAEAFFRQALYRKGTPRPAP